MKHVIIGNSAAAVKAVEGIRSVDKEASITVIGSEDCEAYSPILTTYLIAGQLSVAETIYRDFHWYQQQNVDLVLNTLVTKVDVEAKEIFAVDGRSWKYNKLLVATGASPSFPDIPGIDLQGVFGIRTLQDAMAIKCLLPKVEKAVVIGGGLVSCKAAEALQKAGIQVEILISSQRLLSQMLSKEPASFVQQQAEEQGITFRMGTNVIAIVGKEHVEGVHLENGEILDCQLVIVGKGVQPNVRMLAHTTVEIGYGIKVGCNLETNVPDIYAAGDVAQAPDFLSGGQEVNAIWPIALEQGYLAGKNMAGRVAVYAGGLKRNTLNIFGLKVASVGYTGPIIDAYQVYAIEKRDKRVIRQLIVKQGQLVGAIMVGDIRDIGVIASYITQKKKVVDVKKLLYPSKIHLV